MSTDRFMAFEQKMAGVKMLQKLDDTESIRIIFQDYGKPPEMVYDSIKTPEKYMLLENLRQVPWLVLSLIELIHNPACFVNALLSNCQLQKPSICACTEDAIAFVALVNNDPILKKLFRAYAVREGISMFNACQRRQMEDDLAFFTPKAKL